MPPKKSEANKRRATAANEGPSARRSRSRLPKNLEQGAESSETPSDVASPEPVQSLVSTSTSEVTEELPSISPTLDTPAVTAADTPSTSHLSATPALPSSETATTSAEGTINEASPQTSENITSIQGNELNSHQKSFKNDGVYVELKKALDEMKQTQSGIDEKVEKMEIHVKIMQMGEGYDPDRFIDRVLHGFKCCICQCVLNEPRLCEAEEHQFCLNCISQHLPNSQTCPECRQHLTLETFKFPGKNFKNVLSELKIKCEYINRGCLEHVELGNLQNHVNNCEYRPVTCEKCHLEVNAKDEDNHKKSFCQLGGVNIQVIRNIQICQKEMKNDFSVNEARQRELGKKQNDLEETQHVFGERLEEVEDDLSRMEADQILQSYQLNEVENSCKEIRTRQDEMENNVTKSFKEIVTTTNMIQDEIRTEIAGIKRKHDDEMRAEVAGIKRRHDDMQVIKQQNERFEGLLGLLFQENIVNRNGAQATDPKVTWGDKIIVFGGMDKNDQALHDVVMYDTETGRCEKLPP